MAFAQKSAPRLSPSGDLASCKSLPLSRIFFSSAADAVFVVRSLTTTSFPGGNQPKPLPAFRVDDDKALILDHAESDHNRFYPITNTTAMVRRDPLWAGLAVAALSGMTLLVYGDLLHLGEKLAFLAIAGSGTVLGAEIRILCIHAIGHRPAVIVGRRGRIAAIYRAICSAHDAANAPGEAHIVATANLPFQINKLGKISIKS